MTDCRQDMASKRHNTSEYDVNNELLECTMEWKCKIGDINLSFADLKSLGFLGQPKGYLNDQITDALLLMMSENIPESFDVKELPLIFVSTVMTSNYDINFRNQQMETRIKQLRGKRKDIIDEKTSKKIQGPPMVNLHEDFLLLIPTHINGNHWYATILYYRHEDSVMHEFRMNSLGYAYDKFNAGNDSVVKIIFLRYIAQYFPSVLVTWNQHNVNCTIQSTGYDCGIYTLGKLSYIIFSLFTYILTYSFHIQNFFVPFLKA